MTYHKCGCVTTLLNPDMPSWDIPEIEIEYCPLHGAGPDLAAAIKGYIDGMGIGELARAVELTDKDE